MLPKPKVYFEEVKNKNYQEIWDYQTEYQQVLAKSKREWQHQKPDLRPRQLHKLIFCEHNHVYTLGKSGSTDHLIIDQNKLDSEHIEFFKINRGGDITYHGPGQITGYPIFDLDEFTTDVHLYVRNLEEAVIRTLSEYGITGTRIKEFTGVWIIEEDVTKPKRKICAIGVHLSRWITMHGFAFNVNTDLKYFDYIIPCGIADNDKTVTSLALELGKYIEINEVKAKLKSHLKDIFAFDYENEMI
jgi:lipoyl(octanoyl) transferase